MTLPDKVKFLCVSEGGLHIGHVEYWFRNDVWEVIAVGKKLEFLRGLGFQAAEQELGRRKLTFKWKPQTRKFVRELSHHAPTKYDHLFYP